MIYIMLWSEFYEVFKHDKFLILDQQNSTIKTAIERASIVCFVKKNHFHIDVIWSCSVDRLPCL